ncbi:MAG: dihydrodipicolinate synthase family protein [Myxococcota bacterium]
MARLPDGCGFWSRRRAVPPWARPRGSDVAILRTVEETRPCPGLSVPVVTVLDEGGALVEDDQRALVRFVIQDGFGADVVFAAGTTGEWDRIPNRVRQRVICVCAEEVAKANAQLGSSHGRAVEAWAGITAPTARETLENLEFAIAHGSHAAVLAPLSIQAVDDPVRFVARDVADLLDRSFPRIPIYLYDNADIAIDPKVPHIRTKQVKAMSRLDFVRGIKVSARRAVLGNYT